MGNAIEFKDRNSLVELVQSHIQNKIDHREWSIHTKNALELLEPRRGLEATWTSGVKARYYHVDVRNAHWRKPATNCYVYLDGVQDLGQDQEIRLYTCESKWEGTLQSGVRIQPRELRGFDAFIIVQSEPRELLLMPHTDAQNYIHHFTGETHLRITYLVCSDQFADARRTYEIVWDGRGSVEFR